MSLPKIDLPIYDLKLPSNGKIVKITDATSEKNLIDLGELNGDEYKLPVSDAEILKFYNKI